MPLRRSLVRAYPSDDAWPVNNQAPGGRYQPPSNMEEIGAAVPQDQAVKAVLSRMFITMASALVSVGHLCRKLIVEEDEKWVRFANKA